VCLAATMTATPAPMMAVLLVPVQWPMVVQDAAAAAEPCDKFAKPGAVQKQFRKSRMCKHFARGVCKMGGSCSFAHQPSELSPDPRKTTLCVAFSRGMCNRKKCNYAHGYEELRGTDGIYKRELCHSWTDSGRCRFGAFCRFAHGTEELRLSGASTKTTNDDPSGEFAMAGAQQGLHNADSPSSDRWIDLMEADEAEAAKDGSDCMSPCNSTELRSNCSSVDFSSDEECGAVVVQTTLMISGFSRDCKRSQLLHLLTLAEMQLECDFLYVPLDFKNVDRSFGFGFANFTTSDAALRAKQILTAHELDADFAETQGLSSLISRFRNSSVMHSAVPDEARPALFVSGARAPFPAPTHAIKAPRLRTRHE